MQAQYQDILALLNRQRNMIIIGHEDPDCDCLGSMLGLYLAFQGAEKNWVMLRHDDPPHNLRFLPHVEEMQHPQHINWDDYEAVLLVDCGEVSRTGPYLQAHLAGKQLYCIDHHISNAFSGQLAVVEPQAAAAGEIVAAICLAGEVPICDKVALCLYSAIAADTGCFRYLNTSQRALVIAAQLLPQVDLELVRIKLFEDRSMSNLRLVGVCMEHMTLECDGLLSYSWLDQPSIQRYHATVMDCHNIVNHTLLPSGVKIGIMFEEHEDCVKISFRSRRGYRVDELATSFGGGGHMQASGCKIPGRLDEVRPQVLAAARKLLTQKYE